MLYLKKKSLKMGKKDKIQNFQIIQLTIMDIK